MIDSEEPVAEREAGLGRPDNKPDHSYTVSNVISTGQYHTDPLLTDQHHTENIQDKYIKFEIDKTLEKCST